MKKALIFIIIISIIIAGFTYFGFANVNEAANSSPDQKVIILDTNPATPYDSILNSIGIYPLHLPVTDISQQSMNENDLWIVPAESAKNLSQAEAALLCARVRNGDRLLFENSANLASLLQIKLGKQEIPAQEIQYLSHPEVPVRLKNPVFFVPFTKNGLEVLAIDRASQQPLLGGFHFGQGYVLNLAMPVDEESAGGYNRFPYLIETLAQKTGLQPRLQSGFQIYLDWGYYYDADPVQLAQKLKDEHVNRVYLSAWYDRRRIDSFYKSFIKAAHAQGIAVYAWLEFPMVSKEFWDEHPEWREKTAAGRDAHIDWRYLMALENPDCLQETMQETDSLLDGYDWDGTNLAELYFESPTGGAAQKDSFTPMSEAFRDSFKSAEGFDPIEIFTGHGAGDSPEKTQQVLAYRREVLQKLNSEIESHLKQHLAAGGRELVVTQIDTFEEPQMKDFIGVDSAEVIKQQNQIGFALQIEDSFVSWNLGPNRYAKINSYYKTLETKNYPFIFDINIVDRGSAVYPTSKQTGTEFLQLLSTAASNADQVAVYANNTIYPFDFKFAANSMAGKSKAVLNGDTWGVQAQKPVFLAVNTQGKDVLMDGKPWPAYNDQGVWVSEGQHNVQISAKSGSQPKVKILDTNGLSISSAADSPEGTEFKYESYSPAYILIENKPADVYVDGRKILSLKNSNNETSLSVRLPAGTHEVRLVKRGNSLNIGGFGIAVGGFGIALVIFLGIIGFRKMKQK